jgi:xanthine dehydrogenase accessory factor
MTTPSTHADPSDSPLYEALRDAIRSETPAALATIVRSVDESIVGQKVLVVGTAEPMSTVTKTELGRVLARDTAGELVSGLTSTRHYGPNGEARQEGVTVFIETFAPPPRMIIFGAVDFTAALVRGAKLLGYRVTVCDARPVFATKQRFPWADEVVNDWPDRHLALVGSTLGPQDAVCVLTHDPKFDVPAIRAAVATKVGYLGAMGSRKTHDTRTVRLREAGLTDRDLDRVMAPIGIDIGARTPEETAISIVAEIIALRTGRAVASLRDGDGPIHRK